MILEQRRIADRHASTLVPSDPSGSLFSSRHARPERGIRRRRDVGPSLPAAGFARLRINVQVLVRESVSGRSLLLNTAFRSTAAITNLTIHPRSRVNVPGLHLQS
jgi:hypothetical protein